MPGRPRGDGPRERVQALGGTLTVERVGSEFVLEVSCLDGFVVKDTPARELADAVRRVRQGLRVVDPIPAAGRSDKRL